MSKFEIGDNIVCSSTSYGDKQGSKGKVVELIGEDSINGTTNHKDAILAIKAKYPKE